MGTEGEPGTPPDVIRLRYAGRCGCGESVDRGERAGYVRAERQVVCLSCLADLQTGRSDFGSLAEEVPAPPLPGVAGGAARAEYERRVFKRAERLADRGRLVRFVAKLNGEPQSTRAWELGAVGEERVAARLQVAADAGVLALHDRRIPGRRANIDHIGIGPAGVYVIDAKRYKDAEISVRRSGGLFSPRREELLVRGRVKTHLVTGLEPQVAAVRAALESGGLTDVPVTPVLCFIDGLFPILERKLRVASTVIVGPRGLTRLVATPGPLHDEQRSAVYCLLGERLASMT